MTFDRRTLLQGLVTLGLGQLGSFFLPMGKLPHYQQALALATPRKLALLIGINQYDVKAASPEAIAAFGGNLAGAVTDVERQRELLIGRYGFQAQDILTLTDGKATRQGIETAFQEHLQNQAQTGDVVIVHFSGYGSRVLDSQALTLLTTDSLPKAISPDLLRSTFIDWGKNLATAQVTYILDTSHSNFQQKYQGNLRTRSYAQPGARLQPLAMPANSTPLGDRQKSFRGNLLTAALPDQVAVEIAGENWSGGLFSYVLTRYLWESSSPNRLYFVLNQVNNAIADVLDTKQQSSQTSGSKKELLIYGVLPEVNQGAEAIITEVGEAPTVSLNLTGMPLAVLASATLHSCLQTLPDATEPVLLQITERSGLQAKAIALTATPKLQTGQFLQECLRFIPKQLGLTLALDSQLDRVERVDATSALEPLDSVTKVVKAHSAADCLLGKTETGAYALFSPGGQLLFVTDPGASQAIKSAVSELEPALKKQLALKWGRLTENEQSSTLGLKVSLETRLDSQNSNLSLAQRYTRRVGVNFPKLSNPIPSPYSPLPI
ncbi:MAG: caspase family protein, partial [Microcystaceae cyanobacterium]